MRQFKAAVRRSVAPMMTALVLELAFDQVARNGGAVDAHERPVAAGTAGVDRRGDGSLPVPDSPLIMTRESVGRAPDQLRTRCVAALFPTISPEAVGAQGLSRAAPVATPSPTTAPAALQVSGFSRKLCAPSLVARTASAGLPGRSS